MTKRDDYERFGVGEYWAIDPLTLGVRCWTRRGTMLADEPVEGNSLRCSSIPGVVLDLRALRRSSERG